MCYNNINISEVTQPHTCGFGLFGSYILTYRRAELSLKLICHADTLYIL